ncbi:hypothetical protein ACGFNU_45625 [Spirillospora sp. NPDC048911]|uniref:hypothetical protein n=1 Tax=Spirillospora sp. NPDC048911 TaxID=3364527 RepID=UPI0037161618
MHQENTSPQRPSRRRTAIAATVGVATIGGLAATGMLVAGQQAPAKPAGQVAAQSGQTSTATSGRQQSVYAAETGGSVKSVASAKRGEKCKVADRYIVYKTVIGLRHYDWHSSVKYCWNKKKVRIIRASSYLKRADLNVKEEKNSPRIVFNKKHSAATVLISSEVEWSTPWGSGFNHPKAQYRMWAINGAYTYKPWKS